MTKGKFINLYMDFNVHSKQEQAEMILAKANTLVNGGSKGVLITYSANYLQTVTIEATYLANEWNTQTSGDNQAEIMRLLLLLLGTTEQQLQGKMRIAAITTMPGGTAFAHLFSKDDFHLGIVASDLSRIKAYLDTGWDVLGWQHQGTVNDPKHPYAVGGGVKQNLPQEVNDLIQNTLIAFHHQYQ